MSKKYYLKIYDFTDEGFSHHPVNPDRISLTTIQTVYERTKQRGGQYKYVVARGVETRFKQEFDITELIETIRDLKGQISNALQQRGSAGAKIQRLLLEPLELESIVQAIARGDLESAQESLTTLLYAFMKNFTELALMLERSQQADTTVDVLQDTLAAVDEISEDVYLEWCIAADTLNRTVRALEQIENSVNGTMKQIRETHTKCNDLMRAGNALVREAALFLNGDTESFIVDAYAYLRKPSTDGSFGSKLVRARALVSQCGERAQHCDATWQSLRQRSERELLSLGPRVESLCTTLSNATRDVLQYERRYAKKRGRPGLVSRVECAITSDEYVQALAHTDNPQWAPRGCRERLTGLIANALSAVTRQPKYPEDLAYAISEAERYLKQIDERENPSVPPPPSPVTATPIEVTKQRVTIKKSDTTPSTEVSVQRARELYELVECVGYVLTCSHEHFRQSNVKAMLEVLHELGHCSAEEMVSYRQVLDERTKEPGERERVEDNVYDRWKASPARWIYFRPKVKKNPRMWGLRLTKRFENEGAALLSKHKLTKEQIHAAHQRLRKAKSEEAARMKQLR